MARAAHEPTEKDRRQVASMAAYGIPQEDIAATIGISHVTLRKYYREELDTAETKANAQVAEFLFTAASGRALKMGQGATYADCIRAAMFWCKTRAGWSDTTRVEGDMNHRVVFEVEYVKPE